MKKTHPTMERVFEQTGLDPTELANAINTSPQNVTNWSSRGISKKGAMDVSRVFGISVDWILSGRETAETAGYKDIQGKDKRLHKIMKVEGYKPLPVSEKELKSFTTRVLDWNSAGKLIEDEVDEFVPKPFELSDDGFALVVHGQSMVGKFNPKDMIYVEVGVEESELTNEDFVVVRHKDEDDAILREVVIGDGSNKYIKPSNPKWHDQTLVNIKDGYTLIGRVIGKYVRFI